MLDQNTDRMWFVIGAVIVGAAIIFIANGTIPDIFASVSDSFQGAANEATAVIGQIGETTESENLIVDGSIRTGLWINQSMGQMEETGDRDGYTDKIPVVPHRRYRFAGAKGMNISGVFAYYDKEDNLLLRERFFDGTPGVTFTAPSGSAYARVSANIEYTGPIETWWFGLAN